MFTIKHCHDFKEDLYHSVNRVTADVNYASPGYGVSFVTVGRSALVHEGPELHHILGHDTPEVEQAPKGDRGSVFVMNDHGKTIATYHL